MCLLTLAWKAGVCDSYWGGQPCALKHALKPVYRAHTHTSPAPTKLCNLAWMNNVCATDVNFFTLYLQQNHEVGTLKLCTANDYLVKANLILCRLTHFAQLHSLWTVPIAQFWAPYKESASVLSSDACLAWLVSSATLKQLFGSILTKNASKMVCWKTAQQE